MVFGVKKRKKSAREGVRHTPPVFWYNAICGMVAGALLCCCFSCKVTADDPAAVVSSYSITYNLNDGSWREGYTAPKTYTAQEAVTLPTADNVTCTGYTFAGWYDNKDLNGSAVTGWYAGTKAANVTLWAKWASSEKTFATFMFAAGANSALESDAPGSISDSAITVNVPFGTNVSALTATFETGAASVTVGDVKQISGETANNFASPVTYTVTAADGSSQTYTVTVRILAFTEHSIYYKLNSGGWVGEHTVFDTYSELSAVTLPAADHVTRPEYTFAGWYDNKDLNGDAIAGWNAGEKAGNVTLWAKWTANEYTVTLDSQGATTAGTARVTATYGDALPAIIPPARDYNTFAGYWTEKDGNGTQYYNADGSDIEGKTWDITENTTLYAAWTVNASAIAALTSTGSPHTVVLTGTLSDGDISAINEALIKAGDAGAKVALDMSACTGLISLPFQAFQDCISLTSVVLPDSITTIRDRAFNGCISLESVTIPDSVTEIGSSAFRECSSLTSVTIPAGVTSIGEAAFFYCSSLESVEIPAGVTVIGTETFSGCSSFKSVTIPDNVMTIGLQAFAGCSGLTSVEIPAGVTSIGTYAFSYCSNLKSVKIPGSVTSIGDVKCTGGDAFIFCSSLTNITVDKSNTVYKDIDGVLFTKDGETLVYYPAGKTATSYVIPDSVTEIGDCAFHSCSSLTSVTIPAGVTSIGGPNAFFFCSSLESLTIPDNVTSIGSSPFLLCSNLTSLTFSNPANWYRTESESDWEDKKGGVSVTLGTASENAKNFTSTYASGYYWYKL